MRNVCLEYENAVPLLKSKDQAGMAERLNGERGEQLQSGMKFELYIS